MAGHDGLRLVDVGVVRNSFVRSACHLGNFEVNLIWYQLTLLPLHRSALFDWWVYLKHSQCRSIFYLSNVVFKVVTTFLPKASSSKWVLQRSFVIFLQRQSYSYRTEEILACHWEPSIKDICTEAVEVQKYT